MELSARQNRHCHPPATATASASVKHDKTVTFFEHDDMFILDSDNSQYDHGFSDWGCEDGVRRRADDDNGTDATLEVTTSYDSSENGEDLYGSPYHDSDVLRENFRHCVSEWCHKPHWQLLEGVFDDEMGEAKDVQKYIITFACVEVDSDSPRGLERQICRNHHEARKSLTDNATHTILAEDFRLRHEEKLSEEEIWKKLREVYKEYSKSAKSFARKLGKADEAAVQRGPMDQQLILHNIEELKEKISNGTVRTKRHSHSSSSKSRHHSHHHHSSTSDNVTSSGERRSSNSKKSNKSSTSTDHQASKKDRKSPLKLPSMSLKASRKDNDKEHGGNSALDVSERDANEDDAADLFQDIDKKGKTKRSSRWRSLKKGISKRVHRDSAGGFRSM